MSGDTGYILFSILRSVFDGNLMSNEDKYFFKSITSADVMKLASKHDIAHLVALGLLNNNDYSGAL